ncbi:hypothetical protein BHM03_00011838, partial [Ensete ventricosum]
ERVRSAKERNGEEEPEISGFDPLFDVPMANLICSTKPPMAAFTASDLLRSRSLRKPLPRLSPLSASSDKLSSSLSSFKPLHLAPPGSFGLGSRDGPASAANLRGRSSKARAYEADRSDSIPMPDNEARAAAAQKVKIGIYFATWWALNVVFNIYNKKVLNAFPYPWLTSTLSLAVGSLIMLLSWGARVAEVPKTDLDFWKALAPVRNLRFRWLLG